MAVVPLKTGMPMSPTAFEDTGAGSGVDGETPALWAGGWPVLAGFGQGAEGRGCSPAWPWGLWGFGQ